MSERFALPGNRAISCSVVIPSLRPRTLGELLSVRSHPRCSVGCDFTCTVQTPMIRRRITQAIQTLFIFCPPGSHLQGLLTLGSRGEVLIFAHSVKRIVDVSS